MRYILVAVLVALTGGAADSVTLSVSRYENASRTFTFVFQGAISSGAVGQYVEVLGRYCGAKDDRLISGTQTTSGGRFRVENPSERPPYGYTPVYSGTTLRARWRGVYSKPQLWTSLARPKVARITGTRTWVAHVTPATPNGRVSLQGKTIELQRLSLGGWKLVRKARLARKPSSRWGVFDHQAAFTVPTPGLRLRVFLPEESAAPCYRPGGSESWRS